MVAAVFAAFVHECDQGRPQDATDLRATQEGGARPDMERLHKTACFDANTAGFTIGSAEKRAPDREIKRHRKVRDHPETADEAAPKCGRAAENQQEELALHAAEEAPVAINGEAVEAAETGSDH